MAHMTLGDYEADRRALNGHLWVDSHPAACGRSDPIMMKKSCATFAPAISPAFNATPDTVELIREKL